MFCKRCGKKIPDNANVCPYCGRQIKESARAFSGGEQRPSEGVPRPVQPAPPSSPNPGGEKKKSPIFLIGLLVFILFFAAAATIGFFVMKQKKSADSEQTATESRFDSEDSRDGDEENDSEESSDEDEEDREEEQGEGKEEEEGVSDDKETTEKGGQEAHIIPPGSAEDDGNLFGNAHCYARAVSDGAYLYFRNPFDKERTYWVKKGESDARPLTDIYMKDLHYKDGWIYYSRTTEGDIAQGTRDNNIYRMKTDGTGNTNLTNLPFTNPQSWLSFETMTKGRCFFVYTDGKGVNVDIGYTSETGGVSTILSHIPAANVVNNPCINVVENNVYFLAKDGLHCVDISTQAETLALPGFSCEEYMIYGGVIYYWTNGGQNSPNSSAVLSSVNLDGSGKKDLFSAVASQFSSQSMQINIYQGEIYFLLTSNYSDGRKEGSVYKMQLDGSQQEKLMDNISWFNIIDGTLYYRYIEGAQAEIPESSNY